MLWVSEYFYRWGFVKIAFVRATLQKHFWLAIGCTFTIKKKLSVWGRPEAALKWIINYLKWEWICSLKVIFPYGIWMHLTANVLPWLSFSAIFGNQLEARVGLLLIFQPIVMKHCCERLLNSLFTAVVCLLLFSRFLYSNRFKAFIIVCLSVADRVEDHEVWNPF